MKYTDEISYYKTRYLATDDCYALRASGSKRAIQEIAAFINSEHTITIGDVTLTATGPQGCGKTTLLDRIEAMDTPASTSEPKPFDLEAAKAGAAIVTRDGRKAEFVGHIPKAKDLYRVIVFIDGLSTSTHLSENGRYFGDGEDDIHDVFMAPKAKRKEFMNAYYYSTEADAKSARNAIYSIVAVPVEFDE